MTARLASVRLLEQRGIAHELLPFDPGIRSAARVAVATSMQPEAVYKTLVVEQNPPKGKPDLVMMPSDSELDLAALARALGVKKLRMASHRDAERATGLEVGGIGALALVGRGFPVAIDSRAALLDAIVVSAGARGYDLRISVADLLALTGARLLHGIGAPPAG